MCGCLSCGPHWGPGPQPSHVFWLGIDPATLWLATHAHSTEPHQPGLPFHSKDSFAGSSNHDYMSLLLMILNISCQSPLACKVSFEKSEISRQDGGIGRHTLHPHTTKRGTTTNLKTKNNQNCQKIKLYGSLTTKELKKNHSSRLVGGVEMDSCSGEDTRQGGTWRTGQVRQLAIPHLHVDKPGGKTGEQDRLCNLGFQHRNRKPQNIWL